MPTLAIPSAETIAVKWLRSHALVDDLVGQRVYTEVPEGVVYPFIRVIRIAGAAFGRHWVDAALLEISSWSPARVDAQIICEQAVAALHDIDMLDDIAVICNIEDVMGPRSVPDPVAKLPRFVAEVRLMVHPYPEQGS